MKKIVVTEENFNMVLKKLQRICNRYKMMRFYRVYDENMKEEKEYRQDSIGFRDNVVSSIDKEGEYNYKITKKFFYSNRYLRVTKHPFREEFELNGDKSFKSKLCSERGCLIHIDMYGGSALVIESGDKVQFLPFGGFVVWTDNSYTRFDNPLVIFKEIFIPDYIKGRILNLEKENTIRDKEWDEEYDLWENNDVWGDEDY